jgi:large subunit ribosomal protein L30
MKAKNETKAEEKIVKKEEKRQVKEKNSEERLAIIRIRGEIGVRKPIKDTLGMLSLYRKHYCTVVDKIPAYIGMAKKTKDYATYGEIDSETYKMLVEKRGEKNEEGELKKFFRLCPPRKGFERKGIKVSFTKGGALGYRGKKINELIKKML